MQSYVIYLNNAIWPRARTRLPSPDTYAHAVNVGDFSENFSPHANVHKQKMLCARNNAKEIGRERGERTQKKNAQQK